MTSKLTNLRISGFKSNKSISLLKANQLIKQLAINPLLLNWLSQKSSSDKAPYKPAAFRAFYLEFILELDFDLARTLDDDLAYDLGFNPASVHTHTHELQNYQFSDQQKKALKQYYDANNLLVDFLNNAHYVTRSVREELEESLLVPSEISQRNRERVPVAFLKENRASYQRLK